MPFFFWFHMGENMLEGNAVGPKVFLFGSTNHFLSKKERDIEGDKMLRLPSTCRSFF